jgi:hypothetical protein
MPIKSNAAALMSPKIKEINDIFFFLLYDY